jgi:hypothetical protein
MSPRSRKLPTSTGDETARTNANFESGNIGVGELHPDEHAAASLVDEQANTVGQMKSGQQRVKLTTNHSSMRKYYL